MAEAGNWVSTQLTSFLPPNVPPILLKSMQYSLQGEGKRIRPILLIAVVESLGKERSIGLEVAVAIEMIHTYSLIHDDLPAMDNDDLRRGVPTNHKVFGDAIAILAGDGLLTHAFHVISSLFPGKLDSKTVIALINGLAAAAGPTGMVAGQVLDMEGEHKTLTLEQLECIHRHKTGDLIQFAVYAGAILGGASDEDKKALLKYAQNLGLAFQIQDDILDVVGDGEDIGKPVGSDRKSGKTTYATLLGIDAAKEKVKQLISDAKSAVQIPSIDYERLHQIADFFGYRSR